MTDFLLNLCVGVYLLGTAKGKAMSGETDLIKLYSARILELAADIPHHGRLERRRPA